MKRQLSRRLVDGLGVFSIGLGTAQLVAPAALNRLIGARDDDRTRAVHRWAGGAREVTAGVGLGSRRNPVGWLWARVAGDAVDLGMLSTVLRRAGDPDSRRRAAVATAAVAGVAVADVVAAVVITRAGNRAPVEAAARITVNRPVGEVYAAWRELENLPRIMTHLVSVQPVGEGRTRWRARGPAGLDIVWHAEITSDEPGEHIAWRSVDKETVRNSGRVEFRPAPGGRGTELRVHLTYDPPAGKLGAAVAKLFGDEPSQQLRDDLRRFKQTLETGEVVRSDGAPGGSDARDHLTQRPGHPLPA